MNKEQEADYLNRLHREILDVMDVIDNICKKKGLNYYIASGSLLGAIRHKGFIPWDDDLDITMPRPDFDKFIKLCDTDLPDGYYLDWITKNSNYYRLFAKVCKKNTLFSEKFSDDFYSEYGIFVDIFPLDDSFGYSSKIEFRKKIIDKFKIMLSLKKQVAKGLHIKYLFLKPFSVKFLHKMATKIMQIDNSKIGTNFYVNYGSQYPIRKKTSLKKYYEKTIKVQFEDRYYSIPEGYVQILELTFGKNYMQIPPVEKRKTHYPHKVVFSDGVEMVFEQKDKKLSIEDTF